VPEDCFGAGAAKAAHTGGLRPLAGKTRPLNPGVRLQGRITAPAVEMVYFLSVEIRGICDYIFYPLMTSW
jgi:hypothetical protein